MNTVNRKTRTVLATLLAGGALLTAGSAFAQHDPMMMRDAPPAAAYGQPHMMPVGVSISVGWHGDRYYDGHRYWEHDEWMRHHPHDYDPHHHDDHHHPEHY